ncbi:hypothetical protein BTM25_08270 [Actinomadura rubteroloni]|uniref:Uncharacterized protein n=1 Tax=Actinomadura rubteroloni TaxID=1926885 RepID=A0A2P4UN01_9ACTN|nr:hypothetical protein [Actinomadura rubteroloni]POM26427.1 hypothetical protein BTM25_08270 [Actinomadura rubteroloni]
MHKPARPEELPAPWDLWARAAAMAALEAAIPFDGYPTFALRGAEVTHDDGGGNTWTLLLTDDRAVLYGCDHEMSHTRDAGLDLLSGAPSWLPLDDLADLQKANELGFVYWHDTAWHRVPYPEDLKDDGVAATVGRAADLSTFIHSAADVLLGYKLGETLDEDAEDFDALEEALDEAIHQAQSGALEHLIRAAHARRLSTDDFTWLAAFPLDLAAALHTAQTAGLTSPPA